MEAKTNNNIIRGRDLKLMRVQAKLTTGDMAQFLGIRSRKTIENWESERCVPSINQYILYCKFCDFHPGVVLEKIMQRNASDDPQAKINLANCKP